MRPYLRLLPFMLLTVAVACASGGGAVDGVAVDTGSVFSLRIEQSDGETLVLDRPSARIISLAAHATEVFCALGAGDRLIAVDKHANCPLGSRTKPEVDSFQPNLEAIAGFEPDLVFVFSDQGGIVEALRSLGTPVLYLKSSATLDGVFEQIEVLGRVTDKDAAANALSDRLKAQRDAITARVAAVAQGPRVFHELSPDFYTVRPDTFIGALYVLLKAENVAAGAATAYPQLSAEAIIARDPEVIVLTDGVLPTSVGGRPGWGSISAVRTGRICSVDPDLVSRPGPRIIDGLAALAACLYPDLK